MKLTTAMIVAALAQSASSEYFPTELAYLSLRRHMT